MDTMSDKFVPCMAARSVIVRTWREKMPLTTVDLTPNIGTEVKADLAALLDGSLAADLRALLEQRGVLVFRGLDMSDEQQLQFAQTLGVPRNEHGTDITKV